jgi:hypothetical protein
LRFAAVAPGAGNQWRRIFAPSNAVIVQSLGTPGTGVATTGPPVSGGTHFRAVAAVAIFAVDGVGDCDDDFDADEEHAASTATSRLVPIWYSLRCTMFSPDVSGRI